MKAKAGTLAVLVLAALTTLFVGSASAWHVVGVKAHCDQSKPQTLHVQVKLSDAGPGVYHDNFGHAGTFGHVATFNYKTDVFGPSASGYRVTVVWNTGERGEFGPVTLRKCGEAATTTTSTTIQEESTSTTTTIPSSTSTTTSPSSTSTTTKPPTSSTTIANTLCHDTSIATIKRVIQGLCPTTSTTSIKLGLATSVTPSTGKAGARPSLPNTGSSPTPMIELGVCVLAAGAALVGSGRRRASR